MASRRVLNIGDKIDITRKFKSDATEKKYISKVQDFKDDDKVVISMPMERMEYVPVKIGDKFETCFCTKNGIYKCKSQVIEIGKDRGQMVCTIQFMSEMEKFQRREYFRLEYVTDIKFAKLSRDYKGDPLEINPSEWNKATLTDISGGGMKFNSKASLSDAKEVMISFTLGKDLTSEFHCECQARIVMMTTLEQHPDMMEYRISYLDAVQVLSS